MNHVSFEQFIKITHPPQDDNLQCVAHRDTCTGDLEPPSLRRTVDLSSAQDCLDMFIAVVIVYQTTLCSLPAIQYTSQRLPICEFLFACSRADFERHKKRSGKTDGDDDCHASGAVSPPMGAVSKHQDAPRLLCTLKFYSLY